MLHGHLFRFSLCSCALLLGLAFFGGATLFEGTGTVPPSIPASELDPFRAGEPQTIAKIQQHVSESPLQEQSPAEALETASLPEELVASGATAGKPCKVPESDPSREDFAPVFVEEQLLNRTDFPVRYLANLDGWTVKDPAQAVFYLVCCGPIDRLLALPPRTPERPYLCYDCGAKLGFFRLSGKCWHDCSSLFALLVRRDFMFSSSDMRLWDIHNDSAPLLPGITHAHHIPPPETLQRDRIQPSTPPKYFLTFQGPWNVGKEGSSFVRLNLAAMLNSSKKPPKSMRSPTGETLPLPTTSYTPPADVFISIAGEYRYFKEFRQYHSLFDSSYSLVLHGHGRWSYRLMEVLNGQAIPVILAEGWNLPYQELIDWEQISVRRPESFGLDPEGLINSLSRDQRRIEATRERVREVFEKYFKTHEVRLSAMLRSAALWNQNWREREKETLRLLADRYHAETPSKRPRSSSRRVS